MAKKKDPKDLKMPPRVPRPKAGQPELDPDDYREKICQAVSIGGYIETSAIYAGVSKETLYQWLKKAHDPKADPKFKKFSDALGQAMALSEMRDLKAIDTAITGVQYTDTVNGQVVERTTQPDWKAAAWKLERRAPKKWGYKTEIEHSGQVDSRVAQVDPSVLEIAYKKFDEEF